jgi:hypothetical protein
VCYVSIEQAVPAYGKRYRLEEIIFAEIEKLVVDALQHQEFLERI